MPGKAQITVDARLAALLHYLAGELPALVDSGETWAIEINGTKDGRIYRMIKRSAEVACDSNVREAR